MAENDSFPVARAALIGGATVLLLVVAWLASREPGPSRTGYRPDGSLAHEEYDDPATGRLIRRIEYDERGDRVLEKEDQDGNGRFEVERHFAGGRLGFVRLSTRDDGTLDTTRTFLPDGRIRETQDANGDGRPEKTTLLDGGRPTLEERDCNGDGRPDMWIEYEAGQVRRIRTDTNHDGKPEQTLEFR